MAARRRCIRARRLERALDTPAHIYFKYEGVSPAGSHKPNTAVPRPTSTARPGSASWRPRPAPGSGARPWRSPAALRDGVRGVHGRRLLRPEALPAGDDRDLGRDRAPQPLELTEAGPLAGRARHRQPRDRDLRGGRGRRRQRGHELLAGLGAQPRLPAPDGDRPGGDRRDGDGGRVPRRRRRLRRRWLELRRGRLSRSSAPTCARARRRASSPPSRPPARP